MKRTLWQDKNGKLKVRNAVAISVFTALFAAIALWVGLTIVRSADLTLNQTDWAGGTDGGSYANQTGWTKYYNITSGIDATITPGQISLANSASSFVDTSDANFTSGTFSSTAVTGTGTSASVQLALIPSAAPWVTTAPAPGAISTGGSMVYPGSGDYVYGYQGGGTTAFYRYSISGNTWATMAVTPATISSGASVVYPGSGDYIYGYRGNNTTEFYRYSISGNTWLTMAQSPGNVQGGGSLTYPGSGDYIYGNLGGGAGFYRYSISGNTWTMMASTGVSDGGSLVYPGSGDYIYGTAGGVTVDFHRYSISGNTWADMAWPQDNISQGSSLVYPGSGDYIYGYIGNNTTEFCRYSISGNIWQFMTATPGNINAGGSLVYPGSGNYLYGYQGNTNAFYRYSISAGSGWTTAAAPTPESIGMGNNLVYPDSGDYVYGFRGYSTDFYRYSISINQWTSVTSTPGVIDVGASLAYAGGDYIYGLAGGDDENFGSTPYFYRYSLSGNTWATMAPVPGNVSYGGSLVYPGSGNFLYAYQGNATAAFYRYSVSGNTWETMAPAPDTIRTYTGSSLVYPASGDYIYGYKGNFTPAFYRYSISGNTWATMAAVPNNIGWNAGLVYPGSGDYIYGAGGSPLFYRYSISGNTWQTMAVTLGVDSAGSLVYPGSGGYLYGYVNGGTTDFYRYAVGSYTNASAVATIGAKLDDPNTLPPNYTTCAAFTLDNKYLAISTNDSPYVMVYVFDPVTGSFGAPVSDPVTLPVGAGTGVAFSLDSKFLAVTHATTPMISVYPFDSLTGTIGSKFTNPVTLPNGSGEHVAFSSNNKFLAVAHYSFPYVTVYNLDLVGNAIGAKLADPATPPASSGYGVAFSSDNRFLAVAHATSPFVSVYNFDLISGAFGAKLSSPTMVPTGTGKRVAFSSDNKYLAIAHSNSPYVTVYNFDPVSGAIGAKLDDPATPPAGDGCGVSFSSDNTLLAVAHLGSPNVTVYNFNPVTGVIGAKLDDPGTLPAGDGYCVEFSSDNKFMLVGHGPTPYLTAYNMRWTSTGTFTSRIYDSAVSAVWGTMTWTDTVPANTTNTLYVRSSDAADMAGATAWSSCDAVTKGNDISSVTGVTDGKRYVQYYAVMTTADGTVSPRIDDVTVNYAGYPRTAQELISSPYNTGIAANKITKVHWSETISAGNNDVQMQLRTAPDNAGAPGTWSSWLGPSGLTDYYTDPSGGETINPSHRDGVDDQWVQYKARLSTTNTSAPLLSDFNFDYTQFGGTLSSMSVTAANYKAGAAVDNTIAFTPEHAVAAGGKVEVDYSAGYDLSGSLAVVNGNTDATVSHSGQTLIITLGTQIDASTPASIVISGIKNSPTLGSTGTYAIRTKTSGGAGIDAGTASANTIVVPTLTLLTPSDPSITLTVGQSYGITWSSEGTVSNNLLLYYAADGSNFSTIISGAESNDGTYSWSVPAGATSTAKIKIEDINYTQTLQDTSDTDFNSGTLTSTAVSSTGASASVILGDSPAGPPWETMAPAPGSTGYGGSLVCPGGGDYIYGYRGQSTDFYRYSISGNAWVTMTPTPGSVFAGSSSLVYPGSGNYIYGYQGNSTTAFYRYSISGNTWETIAPTPGTIVGGGNSLVYPLSGDYIYGNRGSGAADFYRYSISGNTWATMNPTPGNMGSAGSLVFAGNGDYIYGYQGNNNTVFYRYSIPANTWATITPAPGSIINGGSLVWPGSGDYIYGYQGNSTAFYRYSISGNTWATMTSTPGSITIGSSLVYPGSGGYIYGYRGGATTFYRYSISADSGWTTIAPVPGTIAYGGNMVSLGSGDYLYGYRGYNDTPFYRYSISGNTWAIMAPTPAIISYGSSLAYPLSGDYIYGYQGNNTSTFYRYSISGNTWETIAPTPGNIYTGGSLVYPGSGDYIYGYQGNMTTAFYRYAISGNTWETIAPTPQDIYTGGSLVWPGSGDYIYGYRGNGSGSTSFFRYSLSGNTWAMIAPTPDTIQVGARLAYPGSGDYIYGYRGWTGTGFYRYSISGNTWATMTPTPAYTSEGSSLVYPGTGRYLYGMRGYTTAFWRFLAVPYASSGTIVSRSLDTTANNSYGVIKWGANTPAQAGIGALRFQVAANNDNSSWNFIGPDGTASTYYSTSGTNILSSLNGLRYIKYKAYVATLDNTYTPALNDVNITFTNGASSDWVVSDESDNVFTIVPATITTADVQPASLVVGIMGNVTVSFTTINAIPANGKIVVTFPAGFTFNAGGTTVVTGTPTGISGTLSVGISGQIVTVTKSAGGSVDASGAKSLVLTYIKNPNSTSPIGTYSLSTQTSDNKKIDEITAIAADIITNGGTLTLTNVQPQSLVAAAVGSVDVSFTTVNPLPVDGTIVVTFPAGFTFNSGGTTAVSASNIDGTLSVGVAGQVATITRSAGTQQAAAAQSLTLTNIQNPTAGGATGTYSIQTTSSTGPASGLIDQDSVVTSDTLIGNLTSISVTPVNFKAGAVTDNTIAFTTDSAVEVGGRVEVDYSAGYDLSGTLAVVNGNGGATVGVLNNTLVITLGTQINAKTSAGIVISGIKNPVMLGSTGTYAMRTKNPLGALIDVATASANTMVVPTLALLTPSDSGLTLTTGQSYNITWSNDGAISNNLSLYYSTDSGGTYPNTIATGEANDGTYSWTVSADPTSTAKVKIQDIFYQVMKDTTATDFSSGTLSNTIVTGAGNAAQVNLAVTSISSPWSTITPTPGSIGSGGYLVYPGSGNYIYGYKGGNTSTFYRYSISGNTWQPIAPAPGNIWFGARLVYPGSGDYVYSSGGFYNDTAFWRYSISGNAWTTLTPTPVSAGQDATSFAAAGDYIYGYLTYNGTIFYRYSISGNTWDTMAPTPGTLSEGSRVVYPGSGDYIYGYRGSNNTAFYRYSISGNTWATLAPTPSNIYASASLVSPGSGDYLYGSPGWTVSPYNQFFRYSISANTWVNMVPNPGGVNVGASFVYPGTGNYIYGYIGGNSTTFYRYSVGENMDNAAATPGAIDAGGSLVYPGSGDYVYGYQGGSTAFYRYSISGNVWTTMAVVPGTIAVGAGLAYPGSGDYIYGSQGGSTAFYRYSISGNTWVTIAVAPGAIATGGSLVYPSSGDYIYGYQGGSSTAFYRYSISGNTWSTSAVTPGAIAAGGTLVYPGSGDYIYGYQGGSTAFYRYSISGNVWATMTVAPGTIAVGAGLTYPGSGNFIYGYQGSSNQIYRYSIPGNSWATIAVAPNSVAAGGSLVYPVSGRYIYGFRGNTTTDFYRFSVGTYIASGTLTSRSFDTTANNSYGPLVWTGNTTGCGANALRFQVAANNDNVTWNYVGTDGTAGTYFTSSGTNMPAALNGLRYIKYKAYLATTDGNYTPTLNDVSISFAGTNSADRVISAESANTFTIIPATITTADIQPASLVVGTMGNVDVSFTSINPLPADGKIVVTFPAGFTLNSGGTTAVTGTPTGISGTLTVSVNSQVVTITKSSGGSVDAAGAKSVILTYIKNPSSTSPTGGTYALKTTTSADTTIDQITSIPVDIITNGGALTSTNVEPQSLAAGAVGSVDVSFTTANPIPADGKIVVTFPAEFTLDSGSSTAASSSTMDGTFTVGVAGQVVTVTRSGGTQQAAAAETITLTNIKNSTVSGATGTYSIQTASSAGVAPGLIDQELFVSSDTITPAPITTADIQPASLVVGTMGNVDMSFTTLNPLPSDGKIIVTFPANFILNSAGTTAITGSPTGITGTLSVGVSGQIVTITKSSGGSVDAAGAKSFTLTYIKNPSSTGSTGTYSLTTTTNADVAIDQIASITADTITTGGSLTATNVEPQLREVGIVGSVAVSFTTANPIPADGTIVVTFPAGFALNSGSITTAQSSTMDGSLSVGIAGQVVTMTRSGGTQQSAAAETITLTNIKNPLVSGAIGTYTIQTTSATGPSTGLIDQDTAVAGGIIYEGQIAAGALVEPATISSAYCSDDHRVQVFDFKVIDVGTDGLPISIKKIIITRGQSDTTGGWANYIAEAFIFDGTKPMTATVTDNALTFVNGANEIYAVPNTGTKTFTISLYFKPILPTGADGKVIAFSVDPNDDITVDAAGSQFGAYPPITGSSTLDVIANNFIVTASATNVVVADTSTLTLKAVDANNNLDTGYTGLKEIIFGGANDAATGIHPTCTNNAAAAINFGSITNVSFSAGQNDSTITMKLYKAEGTAIKAHSSDSAITTSDLNDLNVIVTSGTASKLTWQTQPEATVVAGALWRPFAVSVSDMYGNTAASSATVTITANGASLRAGAVNTAAADSGIATFYNFAVTCPTYPGIVNLVATASQVSASDVSHGVTVVEKYTITVKVQDATSGSPLTDLALKIMDASTGTAIATVGGTTNPMTGNSPLIFTVPYGDYNFDFTKDAYVENTVEKTVDTAADSLDNLYDNSITWTIFMTSVAESMADYQVMSDFIYDEGADTITAAVRLEKRGRQVVNDAINTLKDCHLYIYGATDATTPKFSTVLSAPDDSGNYWFTIANAVAQHGFTAGKSYFAKLTLLYGGPDATKNTLYSSVNTFNLGVAGALQAAVSAIQQQVTGVVGTVSSEAAATRATVISESGITRNTVTTLSASVKDDTGLMLTAAETLLPAQITASQEATVDAIKTDIEPHVTSKILTGIKTVKSGDSITVAYRTESKLMPFIDVYDPQNAAKILKGIMKESTKAGVYEYKVTFQDAWGLGDFNVVCSEPTRGTVDAITITVTRTSIEDVSGQVSAVMGNTAGVGDLKDIATGLNEQFGTLETSLANISKNAGNKLGDAKGMLSDLETVYTQLRALSQQIMDMDTAQGGGLHKLYEVSAEKKEDMVYLKNKTEELKAAMQVNQKMIEDVAKKPVVQSWFEFK